MALLRVIEWTDQDDSTIVQKFNIADNTINCGSVLNVRESQVAIFCDKGRLADVFMPGYYKLNTDSIPILTRLMSWQYGFEKPFKSDIYFVSTKRFSNQKWGTASPIIIRDKDYGAVRVRGYGTYAFRVKDPVAFMRELFGTLRVFSTRNISDYIRSMLVMGVADVIGESGVPVLDMAGNLMELSTAVNERLFTRFAELGLELCGFNIESFSLPPELEKALDESARLGILGKNIDIYTRIAQAEALRDAAKNQGARRRRDRRRTRYGHGNEHGTDVLRRERHRSAAECSVIFKSGGASLHSMRRTAGAECEILFRMRLDRTARRYLSEMRRKTCAGHEVLPGMRNESKIAQAASFRAKPVQPLLLSARKID